MTNETEGGSVRACINCGFYSKKGVTAFATEYGLCRKNPPNSEGQQPRVAEDDWCGEFEPTYNQSVKISLSSIEGGEILKQIVEDWS
ncbi:MAG: hypothetical protein KDJ47_05930 [Hyphomicrobiaceae bacterium]|nr:hypothetical protein [Hyphomicrobiaceae bacterium]